MSNKKTLTTTLPGTASIKDPEVRTFLDALVNSWDLRSGFKDRNNGERFITLDEVNGLAKRAVVDIFAGGVGSFLGEKPGGSDVPTARDVNDAIDALADSIRRSIVYQILQTTVQPIDLVNLRSTIDSAISDTAAAIIREESARASADESIVETLNALVARIGQSEAGIAEEASVRAQKDNAIAQAINTIWANIGGNLALIQDGQLAAVSPASVEATRWTQVQAAAIDPNTGQSNAAIVRQEFQAYANKADGTFGSIYSVRAQISVGGQTVVGGFGLAATSGAGSAQGPTIDFGVRADKFFIAATSQTPDAPTQISQGSQIPFMVLTSNQFVNGVLYPPGVYIKRAVIGDATIGSAQIADAAITSAKIQNASITNAKIGDTIQSNNFAYGSTGWIIRKDGYAEFNDIIIRRASLIASGIFFASHTVLGYYTQFNGGKSGGTSTVLYQPGEFIRGPTFYIETGFSDYDAVTNAYAAGFYARIDSPSSSYIVPNGSGNVYDLAFEAIAAPTRTWGYVGSNTPGQRISICVTPVLKVLQSFSSVTINNYTWALFRQR